MDELDQKISEHIIEIEHYLGIFKETGKQWALNEAAKNISTITREKNRGIHPTLRDYIIKYENLIMDSYLPEKN